MKSHGDVTTFNCEICGKGFALKSNMKIESVKVVSVGSQVEVELKS